MSLVNILYFDIKSFCCFIKDLLTLWSKYVCWRPNRNTNFDLVWFWSTLVRRSTSTTTTCSKSDYHCSCHCSCCYFFENFFHIFPSISVFLMIWLYYLSLCFSRKYKKVFVQSCILNVYFIHQKCNVFIHFVHYVLIVIVFFQWKLDFCALCVKFS